MREGYCYQPFPRTVSLCGLAASRMGLRASRQGLTTCKHCQLLLTVAEANNIKRPAIFLLARQWHAYRKKILKKMGTPI